MYIDKVLCIPLGQLAFVIKLLRIPGEQPAFVLLFRTPYKQDLRRFYSSFRESKN